MRIHHLGKAREQKYYVIYDTEERCYVPGRAGRLLYTTPASAKNAARSVLPAKNEARPWEKICFNDQSRFVCREICDLVYFGFGAV